MSDEENFIIIYIKAHGYDGTVQNKKLLDSPDQRMIAEAEMNNYIHSKLNYLRTKTRDETELRQIDELLRIIDFSSVDNPDDQTKIQEQMCNLFMGEAVAESGVCSLFKSKKSDNYERSTTEINIIRTYDRYFDINKSRLSKISKFRMLLSQLKEYYKSSVLKDDLTTLPEDIKKTKEQNKMLGEIDGLFRIFCPTVFKRNKLLQFGANESEIINQTNFTEHYGMHIIDMFHKDLIEPIVIPLEEIPPEIGARTNYQIYPIVPNVPIPFGSIPFPLDTTIYFSRSPIYSNADPYNINYLNNQRMFKEILWIRKENRDIPEEQYQHAMTILQDLAINIHSDNTFDFPIEKLHKIWILLDILGFKNVYCIDMSCRELNKIVSSSRSRSGKSFGAFGDERVPVFTSEDPDAWEICPEDPGELQTRSKTQKTQEIGQTNFGRKGGRRTRKNKNKKTRRNTKTKNKKIRNKKIKNKKTRNNNKIVKNKTRRNL